MKKILWRDYYPDGSLKEECPLVYGRLHGVATLYNQDGSVKEKIIYENDLLMGNPFKGANPDDIARDLGLFLVDDEEWNKSSDSENNIVEVDEKLASIIKF